MKKFLICVDSDGCIMDTMTIKHVEAFCPILIEKLCLEDIKEEVTTYWNKINLYSKTRGINRFLGFKMTVEMFCTDIEGLDEFIVWTKKNKLGVDSLKEEINLVENNYCLKKALEWSLAVNEKIKTLPSKIFDNVVDTIKYASQFCDVVGVSSANKSAVMDEWKAFGVLPYCYAVMTQEDGSKADCINKMLEKGYDKTHTIMIGDALLDMEAADKNGVYFYPIIVNDEVNSWLKFKDEILAKFIENKDFDAEAQKLREKFISVLN